MLLGSLRLIEVPSRWQTGQLLPLKSFTPSRETRKVHITLSKYFRYFPVSKRLPQNRITLICFSSCPWNGFRTAPEWRLRRTPLKTLYHQLHTRSTEKLPHFPSHSLPATRSALNNGVGQFVKQKRKSHNFTFQCVASFMQFEGWSSKILRISPASAVERRVICA